MRILLTILCLFIFSSSFAQQVLVGSSISFHTNENSNGLIGLNAEILERKTKISINVDPSFWIGDVSESINIPVYLKYNIGKDFKVSPTLGVFLRGSLENINTVNGFTFGTIIEKKFREEILFFLNSQMYTERREFIAFWCLTGIEHTRNKKRYKNINVMLSIGTKFSLN